MWRSKFEIWINAWWREMLTQLNVTPSHSFPSSTSQTFDLLFEGEVKVIRAQTGAHQHLHRPWFSFPVPCKHGKELLLNPWRCLLTFVGRGVPSWKLSFIHELEWRFTIADEATLALRSRSKRFLLIIFVEISAEVEVPKPWKKVISGDPNLLLLSGMTWTEVFMSEASRSALFLPSRIDYNTATHTPWAYPLV